MHTEKQDAKEEDSTLKLEAIEPDKNARPIILVVEDNADIRDYIADSFTDLYEIKTAANGKEGLQIATDCIPDIIVSDIMMPVMNGIIMCQKLKSDIRTSHSADCERQHYRQGRRLSGWSRFLSDKAFQCRSAAKPHQQFADPAATFIRALCHPSRQTEKTKHGGKEGHYHGIYEQVGQGIPR